MRPIGISASRRAFLRNVLSAAPVVVVGSDIVGPVAALSATPQAEASYQPTYFNPEECKLLAALVLIA